MELSGFSSFRGLETSFMEQLVRVMMDAYVNSNSWCLNRFGSAQNYDVGLLGSRVPLPACPVE